MPDTRSPAPEAVEVIFSSEAIAERVDALARRLLPPGSISACRPIAADFTAFECPKEFVVGYGMDLAHRFRELPFVGRVVRT